MSPVADNDEVTTLPATLELPLERSSAYRRPVVVTWALLAVCVTSALAGRLSYLCRPFDHDAAMFVYLGKSVTDGDRFCHDITDNKFPSVGLLTSVFWRLFGTYWPGYVLAQTVLALLGAVLLSRSAARTLGEHARRPTLLAALVYLNFTVAVFGGFQLETIQIFFAIIAACSALETLRSGSTRDALLIGLATGCAALLKPTGLAPLGAFALVILLSQRPIPRRIWLLGASILGLAAPFGVLLLYLRQIDIVDQLPSLYREISLYASQTPLRGEDLFKPLTVLVLVGFPLAVRGWVYRREEHRICLTIDRPILHFGVAWFALELFGALMQKRMYGYHFLPVAAPAALLFGALPRRDRSLPAFAALAPIVLISFLGAWEVLQHPDSRMPRLPASEYLLKHAQPGDAVWQDSMPRLLLETGLRPGARYPIMFIFGNHDSAALEYTPTLLDDLERRRPQFMILPADLTAHLDWETAHCAHLQRSPARAANFRWAWRQIEAYTTEHYLSEVRLGREIIYRRK